MKIFPHALVRLSGGPFDDLDKLNLTDSIAVIDKINLYNEKINVVKNRLNDLFYGLIPNFPDSKIQNLLLSFKRDLHNDKNITSDRIDPLKEYFSEIILNDLKDYLKFSSEKQKLIKEGEEPFNKALQNARGLLFNLSKDINLQKGLLLSSKALLDNVSQYLGKNLDNPGKKGLQTEQGVIKYISRMYAKTSPFSTFTNLTIGSITPNVKSDNATKKGKVQSHIRINNYL